MSNITVIAYAKDLIETKGKEEALNIFKKRIEDLGKPKNFAEICKLSGWEIAIEFINNYKN